MKKPFASLHLILPMTALLLTVSPAAAVTFTNDTVISFNNTNYDSLDIVVTNCTLTVDGAHSFASLQVLSGANLTHTFAPYGYLYNWRTITNELQVLSVTNAATLSNTNVAVSSIVVQDFSGLVTYTNGVDYVTGDSPNSMTILLLTTNSAIAEGSTNLVSYDAVDAVGPAGLSLTVTGDVTVATGGMINTDGKGCGGGSGNGAGRSAGNPLSGSGAGHGGYGGQSAALDGTGTYYDSIQQPTMLGSGGGYGYGGDGANGGGRIRLVVGGIVRVDGSVTANGGNALNERAGGGSGGSIWLSAASFAGAGMLSVNGGAGEPSQGGGGGGGCISLQYGGSSFSGTLAARGGNGYVRGGAGTIYTRANSQPAGQLLVDNGGKAGASTPLNTAEALDLTAQGGAIISLLGSRTFGNLLVASNAWISLSNTPATVTVTGNATIQTGGGIIADGAGYVGNQGPGAGKYYSYPYDYTGGGGGYGGFGATGGTTNSYGGMTYGSVTAPVEMGSGGGCYPSYGLGGAGGGAIRFNVTGMLVLDGRISADGGVGIGEGSGGGSGGSVWLTVGTLTGAGTISANGGMGNGFGLTGGGGGGGGRIAIQYGMNLFFGMTSARGGSGCAWGGAGTIYTKANSQSYGLVLADNGGQSGTNTSWSSTGTVDLTVRGGAVVSPPSSLTIGTLLVASNGWISVANQLLTVTGNATIQAGGGIIADRTGNPAGVGPGAGKYVSTSSGYIGGGGGYGGNGAAGGAPSGYSAYGGNPYGYLAAPNDVGSGGGGTSYGYGTGGAGGGAIRLSVTGVLQVDGKLSAAGGPGTTPSGGGGSGGGINLTAGTLSGSGVISANGGMGNSLGGGGGGGRVAIVYGFYDFSGVVSAYGGGGYAWGGAGTIYTGRSQSSGDSGQIVVDNGGQAGTNTSLGSTSGGSYDLTVKNGAVFSFPSTLTLGNLLVASNGWVSLTNQTLTVSGNATIQAGGGIIADGTGYSSGSGTGAGRSYLIGYDYIGGGGGYGGYGASGWGTAAYGGSPYGSVTAPTALGSGGGGYTSTSGPQAPGGAGGGAIVLNVTGTLQVDGRVSARGLAGTGPSAGGGSGGSIYLTVGTLAGSGLISANGGAGNALGGGGGGGRIAVVYTANTFSGLLSAYGGGGYTWGGAGTVYTKANSASLGLLTLDNGGQSGTNTSLSGTPTVDLTVKGGAVASVGPVSSAPIIGTLLLASNGWLAMTISSGYSGLTVTGNATIQAGGGIIADGLGNGSGSGTGAGRSYSTSYNYIGGGGGYGGYGASGGGTTFAYGGNIYGSVTAPVDLGSGGGGYTGTQVPPAAGGAGGGAIRISVTGNLEVDGVISARGLAGTGPSAGGGSGGSIYLTVGTLAGSGLISAHGGAGNALGGGGGGGRIAVVYTGVITFDGLMSAYGGGGYASGGAGTIYTKASSQSTGLVLVDNGGQTGTNTTWTSGGTVDVTVKGGATLSLPTSQTIANLLVASNGWVLSSPSSQLPSALVLSVTGNATIQPGGGIIADGAGYPTGGSGAGGFSSVSGSYVSGGGGNGGYGAASGGSEAGRGGNTVGTLTAPGVGSAGGSPSSTVLVGGPGGGAITLNVRGTLEVDGRISAAGGAGVSANGGGGAGGGISLTVGTLAGSGVIAANGGAGNGLGGGGGGGRIAINYSTSAFSGLMSAYGGGGYAWGGAGTIYTKAARQSWGQVVADNGGRAGTNTSWLSAGTIDLTVMGGAVVSPLNSQTLGNLLVASNGWISISTQTLTVTSNATVQAGGGILADATGYGGGQGTGAGKYAYNSSSGYVGGGGGYGGYGAASGGATPAFGGSTYGSATAPVDRGSGGGSQYAAYSPPGAGGGAIRMNVTGALLVNGRISANGGAAVGQGSGGGSGGSVWLTAGTLVGAGIISANGGAGNELGGGGGGGCVSVQYGVNAFEGIMSAYGGGGYAWGGAGTIYTKANSQNMGQLVADNGGQNGTNTPIAYLSAFDLTVKGGAIASPSAPYLLLSNLFVNTGGAFTCLPTQTNLDLAVLRNATVDATGVISVDGKGFVMGIGPGAGVGGPTYGYVGSGAGYGGNGGASSAAPGGGTYGSAQQPVDRGSGGGYGQGGAMGGSEGGGAIRFTVGGALTVNGRLSAAGDAALQDNSGGGSGGSIWLTAGALAGNGVIAADGGGGNELGGGGGGGRIAIYTPVNAFAGQVSAAGASGASPGQNGSIYSASLPPAPQVVSTTPAGLIVSAVSSADIVFSTVVNPASVSAATVALTAPGGVAVGNLAVAALSPYSFRISFPQQIAQGNYAITVGPQVLDLFGQPMSQVYTGAFSIVWSSVQGAVTDTNGLPVPGVVLQPDGGIPSTTTDTNGLYLLSLPPTITVHVTPSATNLMFVPGSRTYNNVTGTVSNENYLAVSTIVPALTSQVVTNTYILNWYGIPGVSYQPLYSTNLVDWLPYDGVLAGTNGPLQLVVPMDVNPIMFFRVGASD